MKNDDIKDIDILDDDFEDILYTEEEQKREIYAPRIVLLFLVYFNSIFLIELFCDTKFSFTLISVSFVFIWIYSFISIIRKKFKNPKLKKIWLILIIILPISALLYPDFEKIQTIE